MRRTPGLATKGVETTTIDERIEALTMNLELAGHDIQELRNVVEIDAKNIRALARIAEIHEHRMTHIEGQI